MIQWSIPDLRADNLEIQDYQILELFRVLQVVKMLHQPDKSPLQLAEG